MQKLTVLTLLTQVTIRVTVTLTVTLQTHLTPLTLIHLGASTGPSPD